MIEFGKKVTNDTPVSMLTVGELKAVLFGSAESNKNKDTESAHPEKGSRYVYGLAGIKQLFQVSTPTAHRLKNTVIKGAVYQQGRTIVTDVEKAMQLFHDYKGEK